MKKLLAIIKMSRPVNSAITFVVVFVAAIICKTSQTIDITVIYASLSAMIVAAAGNIINDYFDFEIDKINRPERALPSGKLNKNTAVIAYFIFTVLAIYLSTLINYYAVIIVLSTTLLLFIYSMYFKGVPLIGNIIVALCTGLAFIYGGIAVGNWKLGIIPSVFAFLINLIREILKDVEDLNGDLKNNIVTFPGKYGIGKTKIVITITTLALVLVTFYPFVFKIYSIGYFLIVLFTVDIILIIFLKELNKKTFKEKISSMSNYLKIAMIFGLLAIYFG